MQTLHFSDLPQGGFAGLKERQFVMDQRVFKHHKKPHAADGIGNFVYLADANFNPRGETGMHGHKEIDVISVMVDGRISHAGSLEHGSNLEAGYSQVQRAGGEGFSHNEINPDNTENQMIQLWVLPETAGEPAGYQLFEPEQGKLQKIYGGSKQQNERFASQTVIAVANLTQGQSVQHSGKAMAYLSKGTGIANSQTLAARTLIQVTEGIEFTANEDAQLILIYVEE